MKRSRLFVYTTLFVSVLVVLFAARPLDATPMNEFVLETRAVGQRLSAARQVEAAWQRATDTGAYEYTSELVQTTWPLLKLENVGLSSTEERLYIEGETNVANKALYMKLWSGGGNALTGDSSLSIRVEGDQAWGRTGSSDWQELEEDVTDLFAPGGDPLGYLAAARDVALAGTETRRLPSPAEGVGYEAITFARYTFKLDGPSFARAMRDQMEAELLRKGELPPGVRLDVARVYAGMEGSGEMWVDGRGLPLRLALQAEFPPDRLERVEVHITTDFTFRSLGVAPKVAGALGSPPAGVSWLTGVSSKLQSSPFIPYSLLPTPQSLGSALPVAVCMALATLLILCRNSKKLYATVVVSIVVSMVFTPLLQSQHAYAFQEKQAAAHAQLEEQREARQAQQEAEASLLARDFDPHQDPLANQQISKSANLQVSKSANLQSSSLSPHTREISISSADTDGDGLSDAQEEEIGTRSGKDCGGDAACLAAAADTDGDGLGDGIEFFELGTLPTEADSDNDGLHDGAEVAGFADASGKRWYLDPANADSNGDGVPDSLECFASEGGELEDCPDTDGDGTPDVFDFDDDEDGVPDELDTARTTMVGQLVSETLQLQDRTFEFELSDLQVDRPVYMDFQLRPANPDHLWYTLNVLDWPSPDKEGQVQRVNETKLGDSGKDANGDMRLIPLLEIEIPFQAGHYGNLPVLPGAPQLTTSLPITAWLDVEQAEMFALAVRKKNQAGDLLVYVPLTLIQDRGNRPVAFGARMFYRPSVARADGSGLAEAGPAQKARLVWLVQAKTDTCTPPAGQSWDTYCEDDAHWIENEGAIIHSYYDDWYLTGLSVREDHGLKVGVAFEDPDFVVRQGYDPATHYDAYLWGLALGLDKSFMAGRDQDGDGQRDLTIADIQARFDRRYNQAVPEEERWSIPQDALLVETYTFTHQSYLAHIPMTHTPQILSGYFLGADEQPKIQNPSLLFLREERFRSASLDMASPVVQHSVARQGGLLPTNRVKLSMGLEDVPETELVAMNWSPYRHVGAALWEQDSIDEYVAKLQGRLRPSFEADSDLGVDPLVVEGALVVATSFYLTLFAGLNTVVCMHDTLLATPAAQDDAAISYSLAKLGGSMAKMAVMEVATQAARFINWCGGLGIKFRGAGWADELLGFLKATGSDATGTLGALSNLWKGKSFLGKLGPGLLVVGALAGVGLITFIIAGSLLDLRAVDYVIAGISLAVAIYSVYSAISTLVTVAKGGWNTFVNVASTVTKASVVAAVIGLIITAIAAVGFFLYGVISGGLEFFSLAFDQALANMAATLVVAVLMTVIALIPVVGAIIVAIVGLIDAVIAVGCLIAGEFVDIEGGSQWWQRMLKNYVCPGISGFLVKLVTFSMYSQVPLIDLKAKDRLNLTNFKINVTDPSLGMAVGNKPAISADAVTTLYRNLPINPYDWQYVDDFEDVYGEIEELVEDIGWGFVYFWQWFDDYIDDATFRYAFVPADQPYLQVETGQMQSEWQPASSWGGWSFADNKRFMATQRVDSSRLITFTQPGLNVDMPLYMEEAYAMYAQECIIVSVPVPPGIPVPVVVCWLRDDKGDSRIDMGESFKFDIFPSDLDGFYRLAERGSGGYALAWDERFPVLADADGDGLRSQALGGNDPDDGSPDSDRDGVSDFYEIQHGMNPFQADADGDGLDDYWELFYHTDPLRADTDGDGLSDKEEIDGWQCVYAFDELDEPLATLVSSNPLDPDTDGDGLTDKLEKAYGYNPRVYSELDVLAISSRLDDPDGIVAPGARLAYTATIENNLRDRYALGLLELDFPLAVQNEDVEARIYTLPPRQQAAIEGHVTVSPGLTRSQALSLTNRAGANIADLRGEAGGRILWLHLNESAGATAFADASLLGHDGACSGSACPAAGLAGYAGSGPYFDGVDDVLDVAPLDVPESGYSLALWFKTTCANCGLFSVVAAGTSDSDRHVYLSNGRVCARVWSNETICSPDASYANGQWHHVVHSLGAEGQKLYLDGVRQASGSKSSSNFDWQDAVRVGYSVDAGQGHFSGLIDEVEIYPRALAAEEAAAFVKDPVFHARFDDTQYGYVYDAMAGTAYLYLGDNSSNQHVIKCDPLKNEPLIVMFPSEQLKTGLDMACPTLGASAPLGKGLSLPDRAVPYPLSAGPSASLDLSGGRFSQALWIYPQATTSHAQGVLGYSPQVHDPANPDSQRESNYPSRTAYPSIFIVDQTKLRLGFGDGSYWRSFTSDSILRLNAWNHVVVTYGDDVYRVYVDGEEKASHSFGAGVRPSPTAQFEIGRGTHCATMQDRDLHCISEEACDDGDCTIWRSMEFRGVFDGYTTWTHYGVDAGEDHGHTILRNYCESGTLEVWEDDWVFGVRDDEKISSYTFNFYDPSRSEWSQLFEGGQKWWEGSTAVNLNLTHVNPSIPFKGKLDDLAIYRRTLAAEEVQDLYESTFRLLELRFDQPPGSAAFADSSGNGRVGTCDPAAGACPDSGLPGRANQALRFDGANDYVALPDLGSQERLAVGLWVNVAQLPLSGTLTSLIHHDGWNAAGQVHMHLNHEGKLTFTVNSNAPHTFESNFSFASALNRWVHLAYVYDSLAKTFALYVDGHLDVSGSYTTAYPASLGPARLGSWNGFSGSGERWFKGLFDYVVVLRQALDANGVRVLMNEAPALSLRLDEPLLAPGTSLTTTTFANVAAPGLSGACVLSPAENECACPAAGAKGQMRQAVVMSGLLHDTPTGSGAFECVSVPSDSTPASFTIGGWFKPDKKRWSGDQQLIRKVGSYELSILEGTLQVSFDVVQGSRAPQAITSIASPGSLLLNQWNHVVATFEYAGAAGGVMRLYINGSQQASGTILWAAGQNDNPITIGKSFAGRADEIVVYNSALDRRAVNELYEYQAAWYDTSSSHDITVDVDDPGVRLDLSAAYLPRRDVVMAVVATDTTSLVTGVEVKIEDNFQTRDWFAASRDRDVWLFTFVPLAGGEHTFYVRATDSVGHVAESHKTVILDGVAPVASLDPGFTANVLTPVSDSVRLAGTAYDLSEQVGWASGLRAVYVDVVDGRGVSVGGEQAATLAGANWSVNYPFPFPSNGRYAIRVRAVDRVGNESRNWGRSAQPPRQVSSNELPVTSSQQPASSSQQPLIQLDGTAPLADITGHSGERYALAGVGASLPVITGTVSEVPYPTGPALHMHLEEAPGAALFHDGSRYQAAGACSGGACPNAGLAGQSGLAAGFDGGDAINLGRSLPLGTLPNAGGFSLMAWVNLSSTTGLQHILASAKTASPGNGFGFAVKDAGLQLDAYGAGLYETSQVTLTSGAWTHVAVVVERAAASQAQVATFYVDGLARQTITHTTPISANLDDDTLVGLGLHGLLDELVVYDRALTADQILSIARPAAGGVASLEIGFLHVKDRDDPEGITWLPVALDQAGEAFSTWHYTLPAGLQGPYQVHLRTTDAFSQSLTLPNVWQGDVDTLAPDAQLVHYGPRFPGDRDIYWCEAEDFNLSSYNYDCPAPGSQAFYQDAAWYTALFSQTKLYRYQSPPALVQSVSPADTLTACDLFGACTSVTRTSYAEPWTAGVVILTPTTGSVFTTLDPIQVSGQAYAQAGLQDLTVTANEQSIHTSPLTGTSQAWTANWSPSADGAYRLLAAIHDTSARAITSAAPIAGKAGLETLVYVDRGAPQISIATERITRQNFANGYVSVRGQVNESAGISSLQARLNDGEWQDIPHTFQPGWQPWSASLYAGSLAPPDGQTYTLTARVVDVAGREAVASRLLPADAAAPAAFEITLAYTDSAGLEQVIRPGATIHDVLSPTLMGVWTASADGSHPGGSSGPVSYHVEWIEHLTQTTRVLQSADVSDPRLATLAAGEAQKLSLRVTARDAYDNQTVQAFGPFYVDYERTPAYVGLDASGGLGRPPYRGWLEAPCNLLGVDERIALHAQAGAALGDAQRFYATWHTPAPSQGEGRGGGLRLAWTGANWDGDGDLFIYLDVVDAQHPQAGGSVRAYNPYSTVVSDTLLPAYRVQTTTYRMAADYVIWVQDSARASLMQWDGVGSQWSALGGLHYTFDANLETAHTDLYIPFSALSIVEPANASLSLVAFASEEDALRLWAAAPAGNPLNSSLVGAVSLDGQHAALTQRYAWPSLGPGVCPRDGREPAPDVQVELLVEPAGWVYSLLGHDLPARPAGKLAELIGWDVLQSALCLEHPEQPACARQINTASRVAFDAQAELAGVMNVAARALGHGQALTYTLRLANRGSAPAAGVRAHVGSWGHVRLPGGRIETEPVTLSVGGQYSYTLGAVIDTAYDADHDDGWGTLDVVVFDDTSAYAAPHIYDYPVDWIYVEHEIDQAGPEYAEIQSPPGLIGAGQTVLGGVVYDQSPVPAVTLEMARPGVITMTAIPCPQATTPDDGTWSCAVDVGAAVENERFEIRTRAVDVYGQASDWFDWQPFVVDATPPTLTLSSATLVALSDGYINAQETNWQGLVLDNRLPQAVQVCDPSGAATCQQAKVTLDAQTLPKTLYTYDQAISQPIGDCGSPTSIPITVTGSFTVADVDVGLSIAHPARAELEVYLVAPSGVSVTLVRGGGSAANYDVLLNDATPVSIRRDVADHDTGAPYYDQPRRPYSRLSGLRGQAAGGVWQLVMCDSRPGENDGTYRRGRLLLRSDELPLNSRADWSYTLPAVGADGVEQTLLMSALDSVGNAVTSPISLSFKLDSVAPLVTVTHALTDGALLHLEGLVSDGSGVRTMRLNLLTPEGGMETHLISYDGGEWLYRDFPNLVKEGTYKVWIEAEDEAGNRRIVGPFELEIVLPPPVISGVRPPDGASGVVRNMPIEVDFSTAMLAETVNTFITPTAVLTPTWNSERTRLTLRHDLLDADVRYTLVVSSGVDLAGTLLQNAPYTWSFTTSALIAREVDLSLSKGRLGSGSVLAGSPLTYTFAITGNTAVTPVTAVIVDAFNAPSALAAVSGQGCEWMPDSSLVTCTTQVVSASMTLLELSVTTASDYEGLLRNTAHIELLGADVLDPNPDNDDAGPVLVDVVRLLRQVDLALSKSVTGTQLTAGESITYTLTVTSDSATEVTALVVDTFDTALALAAVSGEGCMWVTGTAVVSCTLIGVSSASPAHVALSVTTDAAFGDDLSNTARVLPTQGDVLDPNPDNDQAGPLVVHVTRVTRVYLPVVLRQSP
ncbi:MAG: Ig-like domain-containing protein [Thermoflexales bacterium]|nr:Ig-like domain-containing protein [Thermoflexales bacterium]